MKWISEYVIVVEEPGSRRRIDDPLSTVGFVTVAQQTGRCMGGARVHRGQWAVSRVDTLAFLFSDLNHAKRIWRSASVLHKLRSMSAGPYKVRIHATTPEVERTGRWTRRRLGPEVWPNPHDPVGLLAGIA